MSSSDNTAARKDQIVVLRAPEAPAQDTAIAASYLAAQLVELTAAVGEIKTRLDESDRRQSEPMVQIRPPPLPDPDPPYTPMAPDQVAWQQLYDHQTSTTSATGQPFYTASVAAAPPRFSTYEPDPYAQPSDFNAGTQSWQPVYQRPRQVPQFDRRFSSPTPMPSPTSCWYPQRQDVQFGYSNHEQPTHGPEPYYPLPGQQDRAWSYQLDRPSLPPLPMIKPTSCWGPPGQRDHFGPPQFDLHQSPPLPMHRPTCWDPPGQQGYTSWEQPPPIDWLTAAAVPSSMRMEDLCWETDENRCYGDVFTHTQSPTLDDRPNSFLGGNEHELREQEEEMSTSSSLDAQTIFSCDNARDFQCSSGHEMMEEKHLENPRSMLSMDSRFGTEVDHALDRDVVGSDVAGVSNPSIALLCDNHGVEEDRDASSEGHRVPPFEEIYPPCSFDEPNILSMTPLPAAYDQLPPADCPPPRTMDSRRHSRPYLHRDPSNNLPPIVVAFPPPPATISLSCDPDFRYDSMELIAVDNDESVESCPNTTIDRLHIRDQVGVEGVLLDHEETDGFLKASSPSPRGMTIQELCFRARREPLECIPVGPDFCETFYSYGVKAIVIYCPRRLRMRGILGIHEVDVGATNALAAHRQIWSDIGFIECRKVGETSLGNIASLSTSRVSAKQRSCTFDPGGSTSQHFARDWKKIEAFIGSKTATIQICNHPQKYVLKVHKSGIHEHLPPPWQKMKASHPYPQKASKIARVLSQGRPLFQGIAAVPAMGFGRRRWYDNPFRPVTDVIPLIRSEVLSRLRWGIELVDVGQWYWQLTYQWVETHAHQELLEVFHSSQISELDRLLASWFPP